MKKVIYYLSPLFVIPIIFLIMILLEGVEILKPIVPYASFAALFLFPFVIGILSPSKAKFDYIITIIVPISVLLSVFVALFFDAGCDGKPQLSLRHALNMGYYRLWLPIALIMMVITFIASFKPIRNSIKTKFPYES